MELNMSLPFLPLLKEVQTITKLMYTSVLHNFFKNYSQVYAYSYIDTEN
jgi:hypothetical protein